MLSPFADVLCCRGAPKGPKGQDLGRQQIEPILFAERLASSSIFHTALDHFMVKGSLLYKD